jgi:pimeloyl-ACP methyl ester carboxylesterase
MAAYVLVGGAWIGAWAWKRVARQLRDRGHDAYAISLTGLADRVHLARPETDLETFITDVMQVLSYEDLREVILVGHSYSGIVVTGVADRAADQLAALVYCDSAPFLDGEAYLDVVPPEGREIIERSVRERGDGWRLPPPSMDEFTETGSVRGLTGDDLTVMSAKATPHPFASYTQPLRLTRGAAVGYDRVAIAGDELRGLVAAGIPRMQELTAPPWRFLELETGHWPMLSAPDELTDLLDSLGR